MPRALPDADGTLTGWTDQSGSTINRYQALNGTHAAYLTSDALAAVPSIPFSSVGTLPGEISRSAYTTPGGTVCTKVQVHALGINDNFHKYTLLVPNDTPMNSPVPIVEAYHGVGSYTDNYVTAGGFFTQGMTDAMLDQGWPVVGMNEGGTTTWANHAARVGFVDTWTSLASIFDARGILGYGASMGGCAVLNFLLDALTDGIPILACALNSAATNFQYVYSTNGNLVGGMRAAYGLAAGTPYTDPTYVAAVDTADGGHDPQKQTAAEFPSVPVRMYASSSDTTIKKVQNTDLFNAKLLAGGWVVDDGITTAPARVAVVPYVGAHLAAASYQPADCVAFFLRALT